MRELLNRAIDALQAKFPPNRLAVAVMVVIVPLVITPAAGWAATWAAVHFPGLPGFGNAELLATFSAGALAGLTAATAGLYKYVDGWQLHEARKADPEKYEPGGWPIPPE